MKWLRRYLVAGLLFWVPLAVAAPLIAVELWFDMRSRGRRLVPELAGSIGIGSVATAIALAGGAPTKLAWGLWVVMAARAIAAIPYVRSQILRTHARSGPLWHGDSAQIAAVAATATGWRVNLVPGPTVIAIVGVAILNLVALRRAPKPAVAIGIQQMIVGVAVIVTTAIAVAW